MRHVAVEALATDGDGTLLTRKHLAPATESAMRRWRESGRQLVLVTGETVEELKTFPALELFNIVVCENGAGLFWPSTKKCRMLVDAQSPDLLGRLRASNITPLDFGQVIISSKRNNDRALRKILDEMQAPCNVIYNRRDLMLLPPGVDKSTGLIVALKELGVEPRATIGVGDGENDVALLKGCGRGVAVVNAVPALRQQAGWRLKGGSGRGVVELIDQVLSEGKTARKVKMVFESRPEKSSNH